FTPQQEQAARQALTQTDVAQPAVGAADLGMFHLLTGLGIEPDFLAGHSYGEYVALCAAGALAEDDLIRLSHRRGRVTAEAAASGETGSMAAIDADAERVEQIVAGLEAITVANRNAPAQTVISGTEAGLTAALARCKEQGVNGRRIPVACGFH